VIRLALRVRRADAETVLAELLELAPAGVEEVQVDAETVEYAVYGAAGELPHLPDVRASAGQALVEVYTTEIEDDWSERWRRFHRPVVVRAPPDRLQPEGADERRELPDLRVRPPWEPPTSGASTWDIVIDPGQAFGTGAHATTRLCLELMLELTARGLASGPLLDVGCGSGVLAIAAARLGFGPVLAVDNDPDSVAATEENAAANGATLTVRRLDLRREDLPLGDPAATTVTANLLRPLLLDLSRSIVRAPAQLLAGGLLCDEVDEVSAAFCARLGMLERRRCGAGEWGAVWLSSPGTPAVFR